MAIAGLALITAAVLVSGHSATGLQMLIFSGLFSIWTIHHRFGVKALLRKTRTMERHRGNFDSGRSWIIGIGLSMPQTLPTLQYMKESALDFRRAPSGLIEAPPDGLHALPQLVLPYFFGATAAEQWYLLKTTLLEGLAAGYAGLVLTMVVAPFAWLSRRHRSQLIFWGIAAIVGVGYMLDLPVLGSVYRAPLINTLRNNRLTFVTGFAILCWAAVGFDRLLRRRKISAWWMFAAVTVGILGLICLYRSDQFPSPLERVVKILQQNEGVLAISIRCCLRINFPRGLPI